MAAPAKRALLIGINYVGTRAALKGCHNDIDSIKAVITGQYGFPESVIKVMRDSGKPGEELPTKANIQNAIGWLGQGAKAGDHLVLHYSGHGGQVVDQNGDEADGYDEGIIPCDYATAGYLIDDWWEENLFRKLPGGVHLTVVFDCCHSGSGMDLPYKAVSPANARPVGGDSLPYAEVAGARSLPPTPAEMEQHKKDRTAKWQQRKQERLQRKANHYSKWMMRHPEHRGEKKKDDSSSSSSSDDDEKHGPAKHGLARGMGHHKDKGPKEKKEKGNKEKKEKKDKGGAHVEQDERFIGKLPTSSGPAAKWKPPGSAAPASQPAPAPTYSQPAPAYSQPAPQPPAPAPSAVAPAPANVVPYVAPTAPPPPPAAPPPDPVATIVLLSGCQDDQSSADSTVGGVSFGALTNAFCKALKSKPNLSYVDVLFGVRDALKTQKSIEQVPQLSFNRPEFDLTKPFEF